jgi:DNA-binding response OmpR family regulator
MNAVTILVVEDDVHLRNLVASILVSYDYSVLEADSAVEALEISTRFEGAIDLLIADHTLKSMTGREVADAISRQRTGVKVLHMSGYPREVLVNEAGMIHGAGFLGKPFTPKELIAQVRALLDWKTQ